MGRKSNRVRKSLTYAIYDGICANAMLGFTQEYLTPFLLAIGGSVQQVGLLNGIPNFVGSLLQIRSAELTEWLGSRKRVVLIFVLLQALLILPIAGIAFSQVPLPTVVVICATLFTSAGAFASPAWGSLISDLVPPSRRGEYFGLRNMILGVTTVAATLVAGFLVHQSAPYSVSFGFGSIFLCACLFRIVSCFFLRRIYEPALPARADGAYTFGRFLATLGEDKFAYFVLSVSFMSFSVNLAAPYFAVLMLRDLQFSYLLYAGLTVSATLSSLLTIRRWGLHGDRLGNVKIIKLTSRGISMIPLLWILNHHPWFILATQLFAGFLWAGFNLSASNFIYDAVPAQNRTRSIAYFNVINGFAISAGALLGAGFLRILPDVLGSPIFPLLILSGVMRSVVSWRMFSQLREVREVSRVKSSELFFSMIGIKPLLGIERKTLRY